MDYEKAYKEAFERARQFSEHPLLEDSGNIVEYIFPELKESEDERIRKELIFYLGDMPEDTELRNGVTNRDVLTWLEKQGETFTKKDVDNAYIEGMAFAKHELEKQGEQEPKQEDNAPKCEPFRIKKGEWYMCVHDFCNKAIRIGEIIQAEHDDTIRGIGFLYMENKYFRPAFEKEKPQVDGFDAELNALLKKYEHLPKEEVVECLSFYLGVVQGGQKPEERYEIKVGNSNSVNGKPFDYENATIVQKDFAPKEFTCTHEVEVGNGNIKALVTEKIPIDKAGPKFKVKYAGSEYNVLEIKEIAGDAYYGIEDEPNHIDYVLPDNCEIVSEQKPACSEDETSIAIKDSKAYRIGFADGEAYAKAEMQSSWSEAMYNFINKWKSGKFGEVPLQKALATKFNDYFNSVLDKSKELEAMP